GSSVISSMTMLLLLRADTGAAARGSRRGVQRRNRVLAATMQDPCGGLPAARLLCGLKGAPSIAGVSGQPRPIFTHAGRRRRGMDDSYASSSVGRHLFCVILGFF